MAWVLYGIQYGRFGNLVENDTVCLLLIQSEYFAKVPADGFSLAVLIGSQPNLLGFLGCRFQFGNELFLLFWNLVIWFHGLLVYTQFPLFQVAYMTVRGHNLIVFS